MGRIGIRSDEGETLLKLYKTALKDKELAKQFDLDKVDLLKYVTSLEKKIQGDKLNNRKNTPFTRLIKRDDSKLVVSVIKKDETDLPQIKKIRIANKLVPMNAKYDNKTKLITYTLGSKAKSVILDNYIDIDEVELSVELENGSKANKTALAVMIDTMPKLTTKFK